MIHQQWMKTYLQLESWILPPSSSRNSWHLLRQSLLNPLNSVGPLWQAEILEWEFQKLDLQAQFPVRLLNKVNLVDHLSLNMAVQLQPLQQRQCRLSLSLVGRVDLVTTDLLVAVGVVEDFPHRGDRQTVIEWPEAEARERTGEQMYKAKVVLGLGLNPTAAWVEGGRRIVESAAQVHRASPIRYPSALDIPTLINFLSVTYPW